MSADIKLLAKIFFELWWHRIILKTLGTRSSFARGRSWCNFLRLQLRLLVVRYDRCWCNRKIWWKNLQEFCILFLCYVIMA